jgi:hypothetical protein
MAFRSSTRFFPLFQGVVPLLEHVLLFLCELFAGTCQGLCSLSLIAVADSIQREIRVGPYADEEHGRAGDEQIPEPYVPAWIEKQQRREPVVKEDVAKPDEVEMENSLQHQPHVASKEDVRHVAAAATFGAFGEQDDPGSKQDGKRSAHLALEENPANGPGDKVIGALGLRLTLRPEIRAKK